MRVEPLLNRQTYNKTNNLKKTQTQFVRRDSITKMPIGHYCGNASSDLAYASMFDPAIAYDLKLMGLI